MKKQLMIAAVVAVVAMTTGAKAHEVYECLSLNNAIAKFPDDIDRRNYTSAYNNVTTQVPWPRSTGEDFLFLSTAYKSINHFSNKCSNCSSTIQ